MSTFDAKDLPLFVHNLQVIILACDIEAEHLARYGQPMQPDQARMQAMQYNVRPEDEKQKTMINDSFRTAIRIWKAARGLGMSFSDNKRVHAQDLVMLGL